MSQFSQLEQFEQCLVAAGEAPLDCQGCQFLYFCARKASKVRAPVSFSFFSSQQALRSVSKGLTKTTVSRIVMSSFGASVESVGTACGLGFRVQGLGFRVQGLGFRRAARLLSLSEQPAAYVYYMYVCICTHTHTYTYTYTHARTHTHTHICMNVCIYMYVCMYVCMHVCMYA